MRLRPYIPLKDYEYLHKWVSDERVHALWCTNHIPYPMTSKELQDVLDKDALEWGGCAYVATEDDGTLVGFCVLSVNVVNNTGFLKFVVIDSELRGKGYGAQMLELLLKYAFDIAGVSSVQLNVFDVNANAKKCYLKAGFVEDSFCADAFTFKNETWGRCHMVVSV